MRAIRPELVDGDEVAYVISVLTGDERTALRLIARIAKSRTNVFHEKQLARKKALHGKDVSWLLRGLQARRIVQVVRDGAWQTTALGRKAAHFLEVQWVFERHGIRFERR